MKKKTAIPYSVPKASPIPHETLELSNRRELLLCGVLGIEEYHPEKVRIKTERGIVEICGSSLSLCWAGEKRLLLRGCFEYLRFENRPPKKGGYRSCR
ncbi:MAG: YabP/YqfC family sporulation protein [Clostridia bacterium]|nr:YabP/YqfC family sporulation protein [Clostridia bacterium]